MTCCKRRNYCYRRRRSKCGRGSGILFIWDAAAAAGFGHSLIEFNYRNAPQSVASSAQNSRSHRRSSGVTGISYVIDQLTIAMTWVRQRTQSGKSFNRSGHQSHGGASLHPLKHEWRRGQGKEPVVDTYKDNEGVKMVAVSSFKTREFRKPSVWMFGLQNAVVETETVTELDLIGPRTLSPGLASQGKMQITLLK